MNTMAPPSGRIGPNAITRLAEAMPGRVGASVTREVFVRAGLVHHLLAPPHDMVDETDVRRLHGALRATVGEAAAQGLAREAGTLTAQYLLAHRIPGPVQTLLKLLPARLAARVLLAAIARHAWTFAGSGAFSHSCSWRAGPPATLRIRNNPLCRDLATESPACAYYAATFEHLFGQLVHRNSRISEVACEACGAEACVFQVRW